MPWLTALDNVRLVLPQEDGSVEAAREILVEVGLQDTRMRTPASSPAACGAGWRSRGRSA